MTERSAGGFIPALALVILFSIVFRSPNTFASGGPRPEVRYATRSDTTAPLRELPQIPPMPVVLGEIFEKPLKALPNRAGSGEVAGPDEALQGSAPQSGAPTTGADFEGLSNVNGVLPPDTVGDIGPNHYVQMVNLSFAIFNRSGVLQNPVSDINTLWQGFGGPCENTNDGDPIVLYDEHADRWLMSQFALPRFPRGPFYECIAISQTPDPLGPWHRYEFEISKNKLNDYPKFGVWSDGYYMAVNQFSCKPRFCSWEGQGVVAFERDAMLAGGAARMVYFDLESVDPNLGGMLPADLDGQVPPDGAPNPFAQVDDNAWGYSAQDQLQIWNFHVDWSNPSQSTFIFDRALSTASFDADLCGYSRNCIPQPGGTNVDAISDRLMYRLQYRNFGSHETLVVNHTVDAGDDHAGIRWYEVRKNGGDWGIYQQSTYAPAGDHRWMGSIAMNGAGDIALGYSVSSKDTSPSIRFTGRLDGEALGSMTQGEGQIIAGSGHQTHSSGRWGDYSMMSVDPTDDCTFWYTQEYYSSVGNAPWKTRIGSFKLRECGPVDSPPSVSILDPVEDQELTVDEYTVLGSASDDGSVSKVELSIDGAGYVDITANFDGTNYFFLWNTSDESEGDHTLQARATDDAEQSTDSTLVTVTVDRFNDSPVASFTFSCTGLTCDFDGSGSSDIDGSIISYNWDFGDTNGGSGITPDHSYAAAGTYTVRLTVTDNDNATDMDSQTVAVSEPAAGVSVVSITPDSMLAGTTILSVTITGSGFGPDATVSFENGSGPAPTASVTSISPEGTEIKATITSKSGGPRRDRVWDVLVNSGGSTGVLPAGFTVIP